MKDRIVLIDFAGTLVKAGIIEEANKFRADVLKKARPTKQQHSDPENFYRMNRLYVEKLTGLPNYAKIKYRKNDLKFMMLTGEEVQNQIATNLFQIGMYMAAKKHMRDIFPEGLIDELKRIRKMGYKLAIISGVRTDIISGMLAITGIDLKFDYIFGQPPILGLENQDIDIKHLKSRGKLMFNIGDKWSDLERVRVKGCKSIFVRWGHPAGGEEELADYTIKDPIELGAIIN